MPEYRDADTKAPLHDGNLERRYLDYVVSREDVSPHAFPPVEYDEWLQSELDEGYIERVES